MASGDDVPELEESMERMKVEEEAAASVELSFGERRLKLDSAADAAGRSPVM